MILALTQLCAGAASGLTVSPNQALVLRHAPREAAGVAGGVLQMSQRIAAAVGVSAISGVYLHTAARGTAHHRSAFWHTNLIRAGVLAVVLAVSALRGGRTNTGVPDRPEPAHDAMPRAGA
ncbi:MFS transporter [Streptomyces malaysiensis]|uniref:hypothetical protein n=1 Tax=Streptomyces malaysiensis TaxID=92644 RepID=UPI002B2F1BCF|nr:hypothetical protein R8789_44040 [Streptomyces malaysiensis]